MKKGTFEIIGNSYSAAGTNLFRFSNQCSWFFRPFLFIFSIIASALLMIGSLLFNVLRIFDVLSSLVDSLRQTLLNKLRNLSTSLDNSFLSFLLYPVIMILIAAIFIISVLIPKISTNHSTVGHHVINNMSLTGVGTFREIIQIGLSGIRNLYSYVGNKFILVRPFLIIPCLINTMLLMILILGATPLLLFDMISYLIDQIRIVCIRVSRSLSEGIRNSFTSFIINPLVMLVLVPIIIAALIIPKFSTSLNVN